jgi:hypothetical protein
VFLKPFQADGFILWRKTSNSSATHVKPWYLGTSVVYRGHELIVSQLRTLSELG